MLTRKESFIQEALEHFYKNKTYFTRPSKREYLYTEDNINEVRNYSLFKSQNKVKYFFNNINFSEMTDEQIKEFIFNIKYRPQTSDTEESVRIVYRYLTNCFDTHLFRVIKFYYTKNKQVYDIQTDNGTGVWKAQKHFSVTKKTKHGWQTNYSIENDKFKSCVSLMPQNLKDIVSDSMWNLLPYRLKVKISGMTKATDVAYAIFGYKSPNAILALNTRFLFYMNSFEKKESFSKIKYIVRFCCKTGINLTNFSSDFTFWYYLYNILNDNHSLSKRIILHISKYGFSNKVTSLLYVSAQLLELRTSYPFLRFEKINYPPILDVEFNNYLAKVHIRDAEVIEKYETQKKESLIAINYPLYEDHIVTENLEIYTPKELSDVSFWAKNNNHCLAAYSSEHGVEGLIYQVKDLKTGNVYEAFIKDKEGNPYLQYGNFQGKNNCNVPKEIKEEVFKTISKLKSWNIFKRRNSIGNIYGY